MMSLTRGEKQKGGWGQMVEGEGYKNAQERNGRN